MEAVKWSQIEAECDGYRAGFVATFRKYEGQGTDEVDGQGRPVKVTVRSFALHNGIGETTFRRWVTNSPRAASPSEQPAAKAARMVTTPEEQEALVRAIAKKNPDAIRKVYVEQEPQATPAQRSAASAAASAIVAPLKEAAAGIQATEADAIADLMDEVADDLNSLEGRISKRTLSHLTRAHKRIGDEIEVLAYRSELSEEVS